MSSKKKKKELTMSVERQIRGILHRLIKKNLKLDVTYYSTMNLDIYMFKLVVLKYLISGTMLVFGTNSI